MTHKLITVAAASAVFVISALHAEKSELYVGLDLFMAANHFNTDVSGSIDKTDTMRVDSSGFKLKFGTLQNYGLRFQGYFQYEQFEDPLFDPYNDGAVEVGLDLIKGFDVSEAFIAFVQGGVGYGWMQMDNDDYADKEIMEQINLKVGVGLIYKITPEIEANLGIDLNLRRWSDIEYRTATNHYYKSETSDSGPRYYIGANYQF